MPTAEKLDLYKTHKDEYAAPKKPVLLTIKSAKYLSVVGKGEPGGATWEAKIAALYGAAYTLKFAAKASGRDYGVCKLEGLWWGDGKNPDFSKLPKSKWNWKLLIRTPDFITKKDLAIAIKQLIDKGKPDDVKKVELEPVKEGRCVQILHVGPYDQEAATMAVMTEFVETQGLSFHGRHHEIYLSDPRRVAPEKLRTILRMPVR